MPSLSVSSIDRFTERGSSGTSKEAPPPPMYCENSVPFSFYPPLYAIPSQQRPPAPIAFSPSPYVVNFKRRGVIINGEGATSIDADFSLQWQLRLDTGQGDHIPKEQVRCSRISGTSADIHEQVAVGDVSTENEVFEMEIEKQDGINSLTARTSKSPANKSFSFSCHVPSTTGEHGPHAASGSISSLATTDDVEFFDAPQFIVSDSPCASEDESCPVSVKAGRCAGGGYHGRTAAGLQEEIVTRMNAEDAVSYWQARWSDTAKRVASAGLSSSCQCEEPQEDQRLVVARLVAGAIASAVVRAEKDEEVRSALAAKNGEISRLWDKLHYLELINREMSQRNQEAIAQRRSRRRQSRQWWVLGGLGAALCMGTAGLICYNVVPLDQVKVWTASLKRWLPSNRCLMS